MRTTHKERPILFNDEMIRAILDGRKTVTRRPVVPQPLVTPSHNSEAYLALCRFGVPGDWLWVREAFIAGKAVGGYAQGVDPDATPDGPTVDVIYRADDGPNERSAKPWTPSIYMPRWASRITLEVTDVRVERLQKITSNDIRAEGCESLATVPGYHGLRGAWSRYWNATYAPKGLGWDDNPFVWVVEFEVMR